MGTLWLRGRGWGKRGIIASLKTRLVVVHGNLNAQEYIKQILVPEAVSFIQRQPRQIILQQDNERKHTARVMQQFLQHNHIKV